MKAITIPQGRALEYSFLALNLYYGPCSHGCSYCWVPAVMRRSREEWSKIQFAPRRGIIEQLQMEAPKYAHEKRRVLISFTSDVYSPEATEYGVTRQALSILHEYDIPFQVLTKGGMWAARDFDLYGPKDAFATTLTYLQDDGKSLEIEPGAALPSDRIRAIRWAKKQGLTTWVSLEPVLDPDESLMCIEETHDVVDLYKIGKLNHQRSDIDWRKFGIEAIKLCEQYGMPYYIKDDLAQYLKGVEFHNTDTRICS